MASSTSLVWGLLIAVTDEWRPLTPVRTAIIPVVTVVATLLSIALVEGSVVVSRFGSIYPLHHEAIATLESSHIEWIVPAALFPILGSAHRRRNRLAIAFVLLLTLVALSQFVLDFIDGAHYGILLAIFAILAGIGPGLLGYYATEPVEATDGNPEPSGDEAGGAESAS